MRGRRLYPSCLAFHRARVEWLVRDMYFEETRVSFFREREEDHARVVSVAFLTAGGVCTAE
jgi:hypothetical protein